ncbi:hypothetical protein GPJ61_21115 [Brevibacillus formosus]|uniref:hypothetical protein n=1 Tax=Brevibacillus formosus TaxID=54913 RepID=UPI001CA4ADCE|nr:hypothetical protein [Brevibacillus formosus]MBW5470330.1 hypothetical protein [Brevibacillus formosus]
MSEKLEVLEELLLGEEGLLISLRLGDGLNQKRVDEVCNILAELEVDWSGKDFIPKKAADLFVDLYPAMESSCGLYDENEGQEIMDAADKIMDRIRGCIT